MRKLIAHNWYDGALGGYAVDLPVMRGPSRFECIASFDDHHDHTERLFVVAAATEEDIRQAALLAEGSIGGMMYYPPEDPESIAAVESLARRTASALTGQRARLFFSADVAGHEGLVRELGNQAVRVARALDTENAWHGDLDAWADVRATAMPLARSTP